MKRAAGGGGYLLSITYTLAIVVLVWIWLRYPTLLLLFMLLAALVSCVIPNIRQPFRFIAPVAVIAVVIWLLALIGSSLYAPTSIAEVRPTAVWAESSSSCSPPFSRMSCC